MTTAPLEMGAVIEALQALRGVAKVSAVIIACEVGQFDSRKRLNSWGYSGAVSREHSSGERTWRGGITKTGNAHLRRIVVEAAGPIDTGRVSEACCASDRMGSPKT